MRIVYLFVLILFTINNTYGQSAIKISSEKVKINGETYYAHTVQKQETLYSLSKAYNTTIDAIINKNASAASGLKAGTILYIPVSTAASGSAATSESTTASAISANAATAVSANASTATATPANASAAKTAPVQKATQVADKKQAKRRLRTCPRLHSKQQSEPSDPGLRPKLEAHQADLEEILLKIPFSGTQSDLLISNKDDNNGLLQTARGTVTVHCIEQAVHM